MEPHLDPLIEMFVPDGDARGRATTNMDIALSDDDVYWTGTDAVYAKSKTNPGASERVAFKPLPGWHVAGIASRRDGVFVLTKYVQTFSPAVQLLFVGKDGTSRVRLSPPPSSVAQAEIVGADDGVYLLYDPFGLTYAAENGKNRVLGSTTDSSHVAARGGRAVWLTTPCLNGECASRRDEELEALSKARERPGSSLVTDQDGGAVRTLVGGLTYRSFAVATNGEHAWFIQNHSLRKVALVGEPVVATVHAVHCDGPFALVTDELYFADCGQIIRIPTRGAGDEPWLPWVEDRAIIQIVGDEHYVYWLTISGIHRKKREAH